MPDEEESDAPRSRLIAKESRLLEMSYVAKQEENMDLLLELEKEPDDGKFSWAQRGCLLLVAQWTTKKAGAVMLALPDDTLYTACIAMPMIARSSGWQLTLSAIAFKMIFLTLLCVILQFTLLQALKTAMVRLPDEDGAPHLCTYGQDVGQSHVPYGPSGIKFDRTQGNIESDYTLYMIRNTLAEMLRNVEGVENPGIGPVEYGMESATCRIVCIAVFSIGIWSHASSIKTMARFLWRSPTTQIPFCAPIQEQETQDMWIICDRKALAHDDEADKLKSLELIEKLDHTQFVMNGITWVLKYLWAWPLVCLRVTITFRVFWNGLCFLMDTGGIIDLILNSLALTFILEIDVLMLQAFASGLTKHILSELKPFEVTPEKGDTLNAFRNNFTAETQYNCFRFLKRAAWLTSNLFILILFVLLAHYAYFFAHCTLQKWPFQIEEFWGSPYFFGQTRMFGGIEFWLGKWISDTIVSPENVTTCRPFNFSFDGAHASGCGLPEPFHIGD